MHNKTLREALRSHTSDLHRRLDAEVGDFASVADYRAFVAQSYAFRSAVEPSLPVLHDWAPMNLSEPLRRDLHDLDDVPATDPAIEGVSGRYANLGRLYVLEGSSMGARLLYRRAQQLGFTQDFGARHLALQAKETGRWTRFVQLLETVEQSHHAEVVTAAKDLFEFAVTVYSGK